MIPDVIEFGNTSYLVDKDTIPEIGQLVICSNGSCFKFDEDCAAASDRYEFYPITPMQP